VRGICCMTSGSDSTSGDGRQPHFIGQAPRFVLRDRDAIYGRDFAAMTRDMGMEEVLTAPRSPWQNPFAERLMGSIRRECLDHVIVWNERSLRRTLHNYFAYYQRSRTHLALGKDAPEPLAVEPPEPGRVVAIPQVGGLHHRYQRFAAWPEQAGCIDVCLTGTEMPLLLDLRDRTFADQNRILSRQELPAPRCTLALDDFFCDVAHHKRVSHS
jgi:hypothetical protein